jgi:AhpD family alkylhydroperoxidase
MNRKPLGAVEKGSLREEKNMKSGNRRIYHGFGELFADLRIIMLRWKDIRSLMRGIVIPPTFRERLMLTVTAVNQCRYCSYAHAREALSKGVSQEEIDELAKGMFHGSPSEEVPALFYAQHWAEADGKPDASIRKQVVERYGEHAMGLMELALRMIRVGNLSGNSLDYILHLLSFGRLGAWQ